MNPTDSSYHDANESDGETFTVSLDTENADTVVILIDDGNTDSVPVQYSLTERVKSVKFGEAMFFQEFTDETARSWEFEATEQSHEYEFENTSGESGQFRVFAFAY